MTAPPGAVVGLYVDTPKVLDLGDVIATETGRRYRVVGVRVQQRGAHTGRQHLRCEVLAPDADADPPRLTLRWYRRPARRRRLGV